MRSSYGLLLAFFALMPAGGADQFTPTHRVSGIGVSRDDISDELLEARTDLMIESQTFSIMREAAGAAGRQAGHRQRQIAGAVPLGRGLQRYAGSR